MISIFRWPEKCPREKSPRKKAPETALATVAKSSCLDVAEVVDLLLSLLGEIFQWYLSVRHIAQLVTHGKTVKIAKSVLCKIIARNRRDIIFNKQFWAPTIYRLVLMFVDRFCWFFFHYLQLGVLKNKCSKNLTQRNCNRNSRSVNFPCESEFSLKKTYNKYELLRTCLSRILATDKESQNICLTEESFLNKITTGSLLNFSFLEVCMHLIANFTCNDTIFERIFISDFSIYIFQLITRLLKVGLHF